MNDHELLRYSRHILVPEIDIAGQQAIRQSRVLLIGAGGLGSAAGLYLAAAGVGQLTVCDHDTVDATNLQRQIAHCEGNIGRLKVESLVERAHSINPDVDYQLWPQRVDASTLPQLLATCDVVVDASDNFDTRHRINAACVQAAKPLVSGAAVRMSGQLSVYDLREASNPCYACLFSEEGENQDLPCAQLGIFAPLVGMVGCMQAAEALKIVGGFGSPLVKQLWLWDALQGSSRTVKYRQDPNCPVCTHHPHRPKDNA